MMDPVAAAVEQAEIQADAAVDIAEAQAEAAVAVAEAEAEADMAEAEALADVAEAVAEADDGADLRAEIEQLGRRVDMHDRWLMVHEDRHSAEYEHADERTPEPVASEPESVIAEAGEPVAEIDVPEPEPEAPAERRAHRQPSHRGATTHYAAMRERHGLR